MKQSTRINKKQRKSIFLPLFIAIVLISSILGFIYTDNGTEITQDYKGYKFTRSNNKWIAQINGKQIFLDYAPSEIEKIILPSFNTNIKKIYIAFNQEQKDADINYLLQKSANSILDMGIRPVLACIKDSPECPDIPIIDCKNNDLTIQIIKTNETSITKQDNCIILEGDVTYLNKGLDKFILNLAGI